ncbi:MAG: glycosyltransferase family A protein [Promethearchaeota archaeon]
MNTNHNHKDHKIVIGMPIKNSAKTIKKSVESVLRQKGLKRQLLLLILDDFSTDNWKEEISDHLTDSRILIIQKSIGKIHAARNYILDYASHNIPNVDLIGRLDADDVIFDENTLSKIEQILDNYKLTPSNHVRMCLINIFSLENLSDEKI